MTELTTVFIHVVDERGTSVAEARVFVEHGTAAFPETAYVTGTDGKVALKLPAGRFEIGATDQDSRKRGRIPVDGGTGAPSSVTITLKDR